MKTSQCKFLIGLLLAFLCLTAYSQQPAATTEPTGPIVELPVMVLDAKKTLINDIKKEDIQVVENKAEQKILSVERDERPVDIVIAIDSTGSFRSVLPYAVDSAARIIKGCRPTDESLIERFVSSDKITILQDFTANRSALLQSLFQLRVEGGQSAVLDAIYTAGDHLSKHKPDEDRRKVLAIITDGEDRNSYYKTQDVISFLQQKGVQVFPLAITSELDDKRFYKQSAKERAEKLLSSLANETGGRVFFSKSPKELGDGAEEVIRSLRTSFRLTFKSSDTSAIKGFRKVEVRQAPSGGDKRTIISAPGYFFNPAVSLSNKTPSN